MAGRGLIIGAPSTGSGKTTITLGLLRVLARSGQNVAPAKIGPDYIDPQFHSFAAGRSSVNLDAWAMRPTYFDQLLLRLTRDADIAVVEGVMGLFDGSQRPGRCGNGSTATVARHTGWPVILVVNCAGLAQSVAALAHGFQSFASDIHIAGVILNNVSSDRHRDMLKSAMDETSIPVLGAIPRQTDLRLPSRHLGLKQAEEHEDLDERLDSIADAIEEYCHVEKILAAATKSKTFQASATAPAVSPLGQRIAIARDVAFRFAYPHLLDGWRRAGAELSFFSPLNNEAPASDADAIYLPGGYPELHGATLANAHQFKTSVRTAASSGTPIFGECGGYMVLGQSITDADEVSHEMLGLLNVETSFAARKLHLGYRHVRVIGASAIGPAHSTYYAHEFHYASIVREEGTPLFTNLDTSEHCGLRYEQVSGSFMHLIDVGE